MKIRFRTPRVGPQTLEYLLQHCPVQKALRFQTRLRVVELEEKLWSCHQDLEKTNMATGSRAEREAVGLPSGPGENSELRSGVRAPDLDSLTEEI